VLIDGFSATSATFLPRVTAW